MSREVKRVPIDFKWPLKKVWGGYLNPFYQQSTNCQVCDGTGSSKEAIHLKDLWYGYALFKPEDRGSKPFFPNHPKVRALAERNVTSLPHYYESGEAAIEKEAQRLATHFNQRWNHHLNADDVAALIKSGRLMDFTHTWTKETGWKIKEPAYIPTPEEVNEWSLMGFGHDSSNQWICVRAECERLGYPTACFECDGEGILWPTPQIKQQCEDWTRTEPPTGECWQMWETTSEGSPISPVFNTPHELAQWLTDNKASSLGHQTASYDEWIAMINQGWAISAIMTNEGLKSGVEYSLMSQ